MAGYLFRRQPGGNRVAYPPNGGQPPQGQEQVQWMQAPATLVGCPPGLEYLTQVDQLLVHQQIELLEILTGYETQNKYKIRNTLGQQVYFAAESSDPFSRQCMESFRPFSISILDNTQKEVIFIDRPYRCCSSLQHMEVQSPPGTVIGYIDQDFGLFQTWFSLKDADDKTLLQINGPLRIDHMRYFEDIEFKVQCSDGTWEVGKISKKWSGLAKEYFTDADNFGVQFPMDLDVKMKAVILAATFLIDFMFFENDNAWKDNSHRD